MQETFAVDYKRGISNLGNPNRILHVMARAMRGETLRIGFIGGSITQGSLSSAPDTCYAYLVYQWWCKTFPKAEFTYINAGIGGTTSQFGVARVEEDLLAKKPDFVIVEFSVNDESTEHFMETYEGLVRRILSAPGKPAVMLVHNVYYHNGANAQLMHGRIARHYDLPAVSMQSTIYPEVVEGRIENRKITPDDLHPNDEGHALVASVIAYFLRQMYEQEVFAEGVVQQDRKESLDTPLPLPLTRNAYERSVRYCNNNSTPILQGFVEDKIPQTDITDCFRNGWTASKTGDKITFQVEGSCIAVQYRKSVQKPAPVAEVIVDGNKKGSVRLDANFDETWGDKLELTTILEHSDKQMHEVRIHIVETHEDDAVPFYLASVISSCEDCSKEAVGMR